MLAKLWLHKWWKQGHGIQDEEARSSMKNHKASQRTGLPWTVDAEDDEATGWQEGPVGSEPWTDQSGEAIHHCSCGPERHAKEVQEGARWSVLSRPAKRLRAHKMEDEELNAKGGQAQQVDEPLVQRTAD